MGLLETAAASLVAGERRLETVARNITNADTPGYKREVAYSEIAASNSAELPQSLKTTIAEQGALIHTGNPFDLAVEGSAYLVVRDGAAYSFSRGGQFVRGPDGVLIDALGRVLQHAGGGDISVSGQAFEVLGDGTLLDDGIPSGAVGLYRPIGAEAGDRYDGSILGTLEPSENSLIRQGMSEKSNVILSDEMVKLMSNQRQVEGGAQIVRTYDQIMAQAISTFSRSGA